MSYFYQVDENEKQINLFDQRFYRINDKDYFSVTGWLYAYPKGGGYEFWLKNAKDPETIRDEAAQLGSVVHKLIELTLKGEKVKWADLQIYGEYKQTDYWERYLGWCSFWKALYSGEILDFGKKKKMKSIVTVPEFTEFIVHSDKLETAGTVDKLIKIIFEDDSFVYVIIDWKTGNAIYDTAKIQLCVYAKMVEEKHNVQIDRAIIVKLNSIKETTGRKKPYQVAEIKNKDFGQYIKDFEYSQYLFRRSEGEPEPKYRSYPIEIDLDYIQNEKIIKEN